MLNSLLDNSPEGLKTLMRSYIELQDVAFDITSSQAKMMGLTDLVLSVRKKTCARGFKLLRVEEGVWEFMSRQQVDLDEDTVVIRGK
ncbi:hypothetical protein EDD11_007338 [Mortierella claussenii]|nr:hypothetical protein EDD11_007338 [Mortierella claussenii]